MKTLLQTLFLTILLMSTAAFAHKPVLTVYTYDSFASDWGPGPKLKEGFEHQCDCTVEFVTLAGAATLLSRLKLEGEASKADVVIGLDTNLLAEAEKSDLFAANSVDVGALKLPISWTNETFTPFDYGYFAFVYNSEVVKTVPSSLDELVNGDFPHKIILMDPRSSTPGLGMMLWMKQVFGDKADAAWKMLQKKTLATTKGWSEAYFNLFLEGEAPVVLSYTTSPAYHIAIDKVDHYKAMDFDEGHYLQVELAAKTKASKQQKLADQFLQYLVSADFQQHLPLTNVMFPVADLGDKLPEAFDTLVKPKKTLLYAPEELSENRASWIKEWLEAVTE